MGLAVRLQEAGIGDEHRAVDADRVDRLPQFRGQVTQVKLCSFNVRGGHDFGLGELDARVDLAQAALLLPTTEGGGGGSGSGHSRRVRHVVRGCAAVVVVAAAAVVVVVGGTAALDGLLQDGLIVELDAFELEVDLPRVALLVVLRQRVELLGVEVADGAQVERVEDDVGVAGVHVLLERVEALRGEGAVLALVAALLRLLRLLLLEPGGGL